MMKKFLGALAAALLLLAPGLPADAVVGAPKLGFGKQQPSSLPTSCAQVTETDVQSWCTSVTFANTTGQELVNLSAYVAGLKSDGVWSHLDRLWPYALVTQSGANVDLVARSSQTNASATFTTLVGFTGNGSTSSISLNVAPTALTQYTQNAASYGVWIVVAQTSSASNHAYIANGTGAGATVRFIQNTTVNNQYKINTVASSTGFAFGAQQTGLWHIQRTSSSSEGIWLSGSSLRTDAIASATLTSSTIVVLASNTSPLEPTNAQIALSFLGGSLSGLENAFYTRTHTFLNAQNSGVFP